MEIREAIDSDARSISDLIQLVSFQCNFSETEPCPDWFIESIRSDALHSLIISEDYLWLIALDKGEMVGVLSILEGKLVKYFFVNPNFHRKGVARAIWQQAAPFVQSEITVRSSIFAIPFYEIMGFKKVGDANFFKGISFQPMIAHF